MKAAHSYKTFPSLLMWVVFIPPAMLVANVTTAAEANTPDTVAAPPPPGPYRAVTTEPALSGQESIPSSLELPPLEFSSASALVPVPGDAPAAGIQSGYQRPMSQAPLRPAPMYGGPVRQPPMFRSPQHFPGGYEAMMQRSPPDAYPQSSGYPGLMTGHPSVTPRIRQFYPARSELPEQVVPPPPVYDAMMRGSSGAYQSGAGR